MYPLQYPTHLSGRVHRLGQSRQFAGHLCSGDRVAGYCRRWLWRWANSRGLLMMNTNQSLDSWFRGRLWMWWGWGLRRRWWITSFWDVVAGCMCWSSVYGNCMSLWYNSLSRVGKRLSKNLCRIRRYFRCSKRCSCKQETSALIYCPSFMVSVAQHTSCSPSVPPSKLECCALLIPCCKPFPVSCPL